MEYCPNNIPLSNQRIKLKTLFIYMEFALNQNKHFAQNWLQFSSIDSSSPAQQLFDDIDKAKESVKRYALPNFTPHNQPQNKLIDTIKPNLLSTDLEFNPTKHFIQGWNGDALNSKDVIVLKKMKSQLEQKALQQFLKIDHFTKSFRADLYNEFLTYSHSRELQFIDLENSQAFWSELKNPQSKNREALDLFLNIFISRVIAIYILKIRFISYLIDIKDSHLSFKQVLLNPNLLVNQLIRKGGTHHLHSKSFTTNLFSWWRAEDADWEIVQEMHKSLCQLNISQIIKLISAQNYQTDGEQQFFSHSLSHKNFGLFLNSLLINFPTWIDSLKDPESINKLKNQNDFKVISCKYTGDYLESLSHAHWLAQDNNKYFKWDEILCCDFKALDFEYGSFFELFNELQFMAFLAEISKMHGLPIVETIYETINRHFINRKNSQADQTSFFNEMQVDRTSTYDRVVLNLCHFPKNNPSHFLISHIMEQLKSVNSNGLLYVLTDKKLFVPSSKDKIEALIKISKLEAAIDLSEIKGKGEAPSFIYIFSKRMAQKPINAQENQTYSLRLRGDLDSFHFFHFFTDELNLFFQDHLTLSPAIYSKDFYGNFRIEFYRDAVVNGRLIRSTDKETNSITHPAYFKKLCENSCQLDHFFEIEPIDEKKSKKETIDFAVLNWSMPAYDFPFFAVLDRRNAEDIKVEIFPIITLKAIQNNYGFAYCDYFGLRPKLQGMNINIFREYFQSNIGHQLIQLNFQGQHSKFKSALNALLIPRFLLNVTSMPEYVENGLLLLKSPHEDLKEIPPSELLAEFQKLEVFLSGLTHKFPTHILSLLVQFKANLEQASNELNIIGNGEINFKNPQIYLPIMECEQFHIYPKNEEVFIQLKYTKKEQLERTDHIIKLVLDPRDKSLAFIEAYIEQDCVMQIHLALSSAKFLFFLLSNFSNMSLPHLISAIKIPKAHDIDRVLTIIEQYQYALSKTKENCHRIIQSILINQITG
jgi:hypothetical protein